MSTRSIHGEAPLQLLAEVSEHVVRTLNARALVQDFADTVTQGFCDWCAIVLPPGRSADAAQVFVAGPDRVLRREEWQALAGSTTRAAIRGQQRADQSFVLLDRLGTEVAKRCLGPALHDLYQAAGVASALVGVIALEGETDLVLHLLSLQTEHPFSDEDRDVADEIGQRLVSAILHAYNYEEAQRRAEELGAANAAKDVFLGMVSHELRTPITVIHGAARLLRMRQGELTAEQVAQLTQDIEAESERLHHMIENLLVLSQLGRPGAFSPEPVLVQHTAMRVVERFQARNSDRKVGFHVAVPLPPVAASEPYVEHMLRNLLDNAAKYSPEGTDIDVEIAAREGAVELGVLDRGSGIDEADAAKLFEPFHRLPSHAKSTPGAGLGLAVCQRLAEVMDASCLAGPREGGGSVFTIRLREYA